MKWLINLIRRLFKKKILRTYPGEIKFTFRYTNDVELVFGKKFWKKVGRRRSPDLGDVDTFTFSFNLNNEIDRTAYELKLLLEALNVANEVEIIKTEFFNNLGKMSDLCSEINRKLIIKKLKGEVKSGNT